MDIFRCGYFSICSLIFSIFRTTFLTGIMDIHGTTKCNRYMQSSHIGSGIGTLLLEARLGTTRYYESFAGNPKSTHITMATRLETVSRWISQQGLEKVYGGVFFRTEVKKGSRTVDFTPD